MTMNDANMLLALAKANYSYAFKGMSTQEKLMLVQSWAFALQDIPADIVMLAFMQLLTTSKWLPTVAEIREKVKSLYYDAAYSDFCASDTPEIRAAKEYIARNTYRFRGDDNTAGLSLESILRGTHMVAIGSGSMGFSGMSGGDYLPEPDGGG